MDANELQQLITAGETRRTEFKVGGPLTDSHLLARITRGVLAMTNTRDGGRLLIGVDENSAVPNPSGLVAADLSTWNIDDLSSKIAPYADPAVELTMEFVTLGQATIVVLQVAEFSQVPVICKRQYDTPAPVRTILRRGALYVRGRPKPESLEIPDQDAMRELLDLATEKQLARFVRQGIAAGVLSTTPVSPAPTDRDLFREERGDFA